MTDKKRVPNYVYVFLAALFIMLLSNCSKEHKHTEPFGKDTTHTKDQRTITVINGAGYSKETTTWTDTATHEDVFFSLKKEYVREHIEWDREVLDTSYLNDWHIKEAWTSGWRITPVINLPNDVNIFVGQGDAGVYYSVKDTTIQVKLAAIKKYEIRNLNQAETDRYAKEKEVLKAEALLILSKTIKILPIIAVHEKASYENWKLD